MLRVLESKLRIIDISFSSDEVNSRRWRQDVKAVADAPMWLLKQHLPNTSSTFAKMLLSSITHDQTSTLINTSGSIGLDLCLDDRKTAVISVEAMALVEILSAQPTAVSTLPPPLVDVNWLSGQCFFASANGWRGLVSEHRLWSTLLLHAGHDIKTPYPPPVVRSFVPIRILQDFTTCITNNMEIAQMVSSLGFDGAPDLILYCHGRLLCVEVKSGNDNLRENQVKMLKALSRFDNVTCQVCCPATANKRLASALKQASLSGTDSDESSQS